MDDSAVLMLRFCSDMEMKTAVALRFSLPVLINHAEAAAVLLNSTFSHFILSAVSVCSVSESDPY